MQQDCVLKYWKISSAFLKLSLSMIEYTLVFSLSVEPHLRLSASN